MCLLSRDSGMICHASINIARKGPASGELSLSHGGLLCPYLTFPRGRLGELGANTCIQQKHTVPTLWCQVHVLTIHVCVLVLPGFYWHLPYPTHLLSCASCAKQSPTSLWIWYNQGYMVPKDCLFYPMLNLYFSTQCHSTKSGSRYCG